MKAKSRGLHGGYLTIGLFLLAAVLLIFSAVGSSRAALTYFSETYGAQVSMLDIGVSLVENGETVSSRDYDYESTNDSWWGQNGALVTQMLNETNGKLVINHPYEEKLAVNNSGRIDEYVRVSIYRYWEDKNGNKLTNLDPALIDLNILTGDNGWVRDPNTPDTAERVVLYYTDILPGQESGGNTVSPIFADTLTIRESSDGLPGGIHAKVTVTKVTDAENRRTTITTVYDYDGVHFVLRVDVDAVQTHNAEDAIRSAWGVEMDEIGIHRP